MRPSSNPDSRALADIDRSKVREGCYAVVSDSGSRRAVLCVCQGITAARALAADYSEAFPSIYCRLEGRWRLVH